MADGKNCLKQKLIYMKLITKLYNKNPYLGEWIYTFGYFWLPIIAGAFLVFYGLNHMFINH